MLSYPSSSRSESLQCLWQTKVYLQSIVSAQAQCSRAKTAVLWQHFLCQSMQAASSCSILEVVWHGRAGHSTAPAQDLKSSESLIGRIAEPEGFSERSQGPQSSWGQKFDRKAVFWHQVLNLKLGLKNPFSSTHPGQSSSQGNEWVHSSQLLTGFWQAGFIQSLPDFLSGLW